MFKERFIQVKEKIERRFTKPQPIDVAERLLDERFKSLNLTTQEIEVFGVDFLKGMVAKSSLKNLKITRHDARESAKEFKKDVIEKMGDSSNSKNLQERLKGVLAYGALAITREVLRDEDLSFRKKKRKLAYLETFLNKNGIASEHSKLLVKEGQKTVKKQEIVNNLLTGAKFIFGAAMGVMGAEVAEKYMAFIPAAQEALGLAVIVGTSVSKVATKALSERYQGSSKIKKLDKALDKAQPILLGIGVGLFGHGIFEQLTSVNDAIKTQGGMDISSRLEGVHKQPVMEPSYTEVPQNPVTPTIPQPTVSVETVNSLSYTVTGNEYGGITDIAHRFYGDPYGGDMTRLIIQNEDILTNPNRIGHEEARKLIDFLKDNPSYTWREAMNQSAINGKATEISKLFTSSLKFIRPGTTFIVPVQ